MGEGLKQIFPQRRHTNDRQAQENMFNVPNHQGNAIQNHSEIPHHTMKMAAIKNKNRK